MWSYLPRCQSIFSIQPVCCNLVDRALLQLGKAIGIDPVNTTESSHLLNFFLTRFVLASTQELHEKIAELATRVRQLEDGLRSSHAQLSSESHPLLSEDLLRIKAPLQREPAPHRNNLQITVKEEEDQNPDVVDAFGSLSITLSGRAKYFGQTANSWVCYILFSPTQLEFDICHPVLSPGLSPCCSLPWIINREFGRMSPLRRRNRTITL